MKKEGLSLVLLPETLAICRLAPSDSIPKWALDSSFFSISRTPDELSIVCIQSQVPDSIKCERNWRCFKVEGILDFGLTGILASLVKPLAEASISLFALSTHDTDYLLVNQDVVDKAIVALAKAGHRFEKS